MANGGRTHSPQDDQGGTQITAVPYEEEEQTQQVDRATILGLQSDPEGETDGTRPPTPDPELTAPGVPNPVAEEPGSEG